MALPGEVRMKGDILKYKAYMQVVIDKTGYDFSGYSRDSLSEKLSKFISSESIGSADELRDLIDTNRITQEKLLNSLLVNYSEMFRDPEFFNSLRSNVLPYLATLQKIMIWHAGCSTGEEVYSLAILLDEYRLLDRCEIHVTETCEESLENTRRGIYPLSRLKESAARYYRSGGRKNLSAYYTAFYDYAIFSSYLLNQVKFTNHELGYDKRLDKFNLVICKDIFIYFDSNLQKSVLKSFANNLHHGGFLAMGLKEYDIDIKNTNLNVVDERQKIFMKKSNV